MSALATAARAGYESRFGADIARKWAKPWDAQTPEVHAVWVAAIRAGLETLREPTPEMIEPGRALVLVDRMGGQMPGGGRTKAGVACDIYRAMIDQALKP